MGICLSAEQRESRQRSHEIDKQLEEDNKRLKQECKLLLLGSGESGKSTIVKQMKIIHQDGYSTDELLSWRLCIYKNLIESAKDLVNALEIVDIQFEVRHNKRHAQVIQEYATPTDPKHNFSPEIIVSIESIWHDPVIKSVLDRGGSEFYIMDSAPYFLSEVRRLSEANYVPTVADVLRARLKSTGILETRFTMGQLSIHMFDVGGQRSERKKWIHCFEAVTSIIFCVALSEYDQVLLEESKQNRMLESLILFESVINSRWFVRSSIILFLNKVDIFKTKIAKVPMERYFPDYTGGNDVTKGARYILWRFNQANRMKLTIYPHLTQATDTSSVMFQALAETILQNSLVDSGLS
ncbi:G-protein alpha subunit [Umbelopsis sp. PMI_123]|nr:G-protein alpha subunit [Umbelopsis sp. PMI_123]